MRFLKLTLAYDGTDYVGWQVQPNGVSVQAMLEQAWNSITGEQLRITASGRTDSGVHALGQVASLETRSDLPEPRLREALNARLPNDIRIHQVEPAAVNFHAIRDAVAKTYRYCIQDGRLPDLFARRYAWHIPVDLDVQAMSEAGQRLTGRNDFSSFQASGSERLDAVRTVSNLQVTVCRPSPFRQIEIEVTADGFLYNMVRNMVGTLVEAGRGKLNPADMPRIIEARDRAAAGPTAPAHGLFLVSVDYNRAG